MNALATAGDHNGNGRVVEGGIQAGVLIGGGVVAGKVGRAISRLVGGSRRAAAASGVRILDRDGSTIIGAFDVAGGEARFIGELSRNGDDLFLRGAHIEGDATVREIIEAGRAFGREVGAKRVIVQGGRRTTGARPGHVPSTSRPDYDHSAPCRLEKGVEDRVPRTDNSGSDLMFAFGSQAARGFAVGG